MSRFLTAENHHTMKKGILLSDKSSLGVLANRKVATKEVEDVKQNVT